LQPQGQAAHRASAVLREGAGVVRGVAGRRVDPGRRPQTRQALPVLRVELQQDLTELIAQAGGLRHRALALGHEQLQHGGLVVRGDDGEGRGLAPDEQRHGARVEAVALLDLARPSALTCRPTRVDLVDLGLRRDEVLRQAATIIPGPRDPPAARHAERRRPLLH